MGWFVKIVRESTNWVKGELGIGVQGWVRGGWLGVVGMCVGRLSGVDSCFRRNDGVGWLGFGEGCVRAWIYGFPLLGMTDVIGGVLGERP